MIQLAYVSSARGLLDSEDIKDILRVSRRKNRSLEITGMLLYKGGNILQILEGDRPKVEDLYEVIRKDPRHKDVLKLYEKEVCERDFPEWNMGFSDLGVEDTKKLEGFSEILDPGFDMHQLKPSAAAELLKVFKTGMR